MTAECTVCYATDINFLLPTLVSASGLRKFVSEDKADVLIVLVNEDSARVQELSTFLEPLKIRVAGMDGSHYEKSAKDNFKNNPVSAATLARFFLDDLLPNSCQRLVYLDGDVWMHRDPSLLIETMVPEGKFAAAEDMMSFRYSHFTPRGRPLLPYFKGLRLDSKNGYFNAGVFSTSRKTWKTISTEAHAYFINNTALCKYNDQSALNAVIGDRRLRLSLKWNFQTPYRLLHIEDKINPVIYHFHSHPKPWMGAVEPWQDIYERYLAAIAPFTSLNLPIKKLDQNSLNQHNKMNWRKNLLRKSPFVARMARMHLGINTYEKNAWM